MEPCLPLGGSVGSRRTQARTAADAMPCPFVLCPPAAGRMAPLTCCTQRQGAVCWAIATSWHGTGYLWQGRPAVLTTAVAGRLCLRTVHSGQQQPHQRSRSNPSSSSKHSSRSSSRQAVRSRHRPTHHRLWQGRRQCSLLQYRHQHQHRQLRPAAKPATLMIPAAAAARTPKCCSYSAAM